MGNKIKILILEDVLTDLELVLYELKKAEINFIHYHVDSEQDFRNALLEFSPDIILSDYNLPLFTGMEALKLTKEISPLTPLIILTGTMNEEIAVDCIKTGAVDYVLKDNLTRLAPAIHGALERKELTDQKIKIEKKLIKSEESFRTLYENSSIGLYRTTPEGKILLANPTLLRMLGYSSFEELEKEGSDSFFQRKSFHNQIESTDKVLGLEFAWTKKDGTVTHVRENTKSIKDENGQTLYYDGTVEDISKRKQAEEALAYEHHLFNTFMNHIPDFINFKDTKGRFIRINKALATRFGLSNIKQAIGKTDFDFFEKKYAQSTYEETQEIIRTGKLSLKEKKKKLSDGRETWISAITVPFYDRDDQIIGTMGISRDISKNKQAEAALRQSELKYRLLFKNMMDGFALHEIVLNKKGQAIDYIFLEINSAFEKITGLKSTEIVGKKVTELLQGIEKDPADWIKTYGKVALDGQEIRFEQYLQPLAKWFSVMAFCPRKGQFATILEDITEQRRKEEEIKRQNSFLDTVMTQSPFAMWIADKKGKIIRTNRSLNNLLQLSDDQIIGKYNILKDANLIEQGVIPKVKGVFESKKATRFSIRWQAAKAGSDGFKKDTDLWIDVSMFPVLDMEGELINVVCQWVDITELHIVNKALLESKKMIERIINNIPVRVFWKDKNLVYLGCNEIFARDAGLGNPQDIIGKDDYQMVWRAQADPYREDDLQVIKSGSSKLHIEEEQTTPDGKTITLLTSKIPLRDSNNNINGILGTYVDISERKQMENELKINEKRYYNSQKIGKVGNWEYDIRRQNFWGSEEARRIYGLNPESKEFTIEEIENCIPERERVHQALLDLIAENKKYELEFDIITKDKGESKTIYSIANLERDEKGTPARIIGLVTDISERKRAEILINTTHEILQLQYGNHTYKKLFAATHRILSHVMDTSNIYFCRYDIDNDLLEYPYWVDEKDVYESKKLSGSHSLDEKIIKTKKSFLVGHYEFLKMVDRKEIIPFRTVPQSWMGVPLIIKKKAYGAIVVQSYRPEILFSQNDLQVLESVSEKVSLLIENKLVSDELNIYRENLEDLVKERTKELEISHLEIKKLSNVVEQSPAAVVITDPNGKIEYVNSTFAKLTGYDSKEAFGNNANILKSGYHSEKFYQELWKTISDGNVWKGELKNKKKDGTLFWESAYISPTITEENKIVNYVAVKQDITDRKEAIEKLVRSESELKKAKVIAEKATNSKSKFLANMSHEIRTPLNAIIGLNRLLHDTGLNQKQQDYAVKINMASQNLLGIINEILDFSKIEADRLDLESVDFDMNNILNSVANMVFEKAQEKGLEIIFDMDRNIPSLLVGDPIRLQQILINLISNAVKFTEHGHIILILAILRKTRKQVVIKFSVKDTGIGISAKEQARLFTAYSQADSSTTRRYGGSGLGLSISKKLVEMMGGEIGVKSVKGKGSTFFFTVNLNYREQMDDVFSQPPVGLRNLRVLVVDDIKEIREVIREQLERFTFKAIAVESADQAMVELTNAFKSGDKYYDLVIMDWKMEGINGIEAAKQIKNNPLISHKPKIILVSAYINKQTLNKNDFSYIDSFINKPFGLSELFNTILNVFGKGVWDKYQLPGYDTNIPLNFEKIKGARILLVEDNEINLHVAKETLEQQGFWVTAANNGQEAVDKIKESSLENNFDAVLMDLQMPGMDGFQSTKKIREEKVFANLPIIAMTANVVGNIRERCLDAGMTDYISKPFEPLELFSTLVKWIKPGNREIYNDNRGVSRQTTAINRPLPIIDYLDTKKGIARLNGNTDAYIKIILKFKKNQHNVLDQIKKSIKNKRIEEARALVHAIKGVSGNINADGLFKTSIVLEDTLANKDSKNITDALNNFEKEFVNVLNSISKYEKKVNQKQRSAKGNVKTVDVDIQEDLKLLSSTIEELAKLLKDNNMRSHELLGVLQNKAQSIPLKDLIDKINKCLDSYDFNMASDHIIKFNMHYKA